MTSEVEVWGVTQIDDSRFTGGAAHFDLEGVVAGGLEGHLCHQSPGVALVKAIRDVAHYDLIAVHV